MKSLPSLSAGPASDEPLNRLRTRKGRKNTKSKNLGAPAKNMKNRSFGRYPEVLIGLALILAGVLFSLVISSTDESQPQTSIVVLSSELQKDEILKMEHLTTAKVNSDSAFRFLNLTGARDLVGQKVLLNLPVNSPVLKEYFSQSPKLLPGQVLAGLKLGVGQYPASNLQKGDQVDVVVVESGAAYTLLEKVEVYASARLNESAGSDMFVTIVIPYLEELSLAEAAENASLRLFLNPASGGIL